MSSKSSTLTLVSCLILGLVLLAVPLVVTADDESAVTSPPERPVGERLSQYGPSAEYPYGRLNPAAPPETAQFAFMVGEFDRIDYFFQPDGTWTEEPGGEWNASFIMNGWAIQDYSLNPVRQQTTTNLRIFDPEKGRWIVHWIKLPGYSTLISEGAKEGDRIVIRSANYPEEPYQEYIFHDITDSGYKWVGQRVQDGKTLPFWRIEMTRKKGTKSPSGQ